MATIDTVVKSIVEHQQAIMGPLAIEQANKVTGLSVSDGATISVKVSRADAKSLLSDLVTKYEQLFGQASVEVCRDAVKEVKPNVSDDQLPSILR